MNTDTLNTSDNTGIYHEEDLTMKSPDNTGIYQEADLTNKYRNDNYPFILPSGKYRERRNTDPKHKPNLNALKAFALLPIDLMTIGFGTIYVLCNCVSIAMGAH